MKQRKTVTKKDTFQARLAFYLSLGFWIPLFNIGLAITSIVIAFRALSMMRQNDQVGGFKYAVAALIISFAVTAGSFIFIGVYMFRQLTCESLPPLF